MEYGKVAGIDKPVSRMVFGPDRLRSRRLSWLPDWDLEHEAYSLLERSFELGCNSFDTARIYLDSERTLGLDPETPEPRQGCRHQQAVPPHRSGRRRLSRLMCGTIFTRPSRRSALMSSICFFFTTTTPNARVQPVTERLNRHIDEGKITAIGASNWSHERIADANAVAASHGLKLLCASTVQFSLADSTRSPWPGAATIGGEGERAARDWYSKDGLSVFAWSTLSRGFFSNHYDPKYLSRQPREPVVCNVLRH